MIDFICKLNCNFSNEDKENCKPVVLKMIDLCNIARRESLLALELEAEKEENFFLKTALNLIIDGTDPGLVKNILQTIILSDKYSGKELLSRLIITEGTLAMQQGENPRIITLKLCSLLGEKYIKNITNELYNDKFDSKYYYEFLKKLSKFESEPESIEFESTLLQIDNRAIQILFREEDFDESSLIMALYGCSNVLIRKITNNMSMRRRLMFCENWEVITPVSKDSIIRSQKKILEKIYLLEKEGMIIIDISKYIQ